MSKLRVHVDQGRRSTNRNQNADNDIIRVDNARGDAVEWGGTLEMCCAHCGKTVAYFVQPTPDTAHVESSEDRCIIIAKPGERENDVV